MNIKNLTVVCAVIVVFLTGTLSNAILVPEYPEGQLIVKVKGAGVRSSSVGHNSFRSILQQYNGKINRATYPGSKDVAVSSSGGKSAIYLVQVESNNDIDEITRQLNELEYVEYVEPNYYVFADVAPNDPKIKDQPYMAQVKVDDVWNVARPISSTDVVVAVLDTGVEYTHKDLLDNMWINDGEIPENGIDDDGNGFVDDIYGYDFTSYGYGAGDPDPDDDYGHGTHVSGIIAGVANNNTGIAGVAGDCTRIMAVKFLDHLGRGMQFDAASAIYYAVDNGAQVINCSWGYFSYTQALQDAIVYARQHGVYVVASVGNKNWDVRQYPAAFPEVIAVGAVDRNDKKAYFSNFGDYISIVAPGIDIYSTYPGNSYRYLSGTSQSAPIVAGVISLVLSSVPEINYDRLTSILFSNSFDITDPVSDGIDYPGWDEFTGYGKVDSYTSLKCAVDAFSTGPVTVFATGNASEEVSLSKVYNYPNPASSSTQFGYLLTGTQADVTITVVDMYGNVVNKLEYPSQVAGVYIKTPVWDLRDQLGEILPGGVYFYTINATFQNGKSLTERSKMAIIR